MSILFEQLEQYDFEEKRIFVLVDSNTEKLCLPLLKRSFPEARVIVVPAGEKSKSLEWCAHIWHQLMEAHADRMSLLINLGGGMVCDMGGFCAAVYKRGISYINIPTTLLAMVDASFGGKTGINFHEAKNMIGAFKEPLDTLIEPVFLNTLPERHFRAGLVEVMKHALIANKPFWKELMEINPTEPNGLRKLIKTSIAIKKDITESDPFEYGRRKKLNFGHTVGHAIETVALEEGFDVLHGEAVAAGIICESYISFRTIGLTEKNLTSIKKTMNRIVPKLDIEHMNMDKIKQALLHDKKNIRGLVNMTLIKAPGKAVIDNFCDEEILDEAFAYYLI